MLCCEGVAAYLERSTLRALLEQLRAIAAPGTQLAISLPVATTADHRETQRSFGAKVAAMGEPARTSLTAQDADELLATTGWRPAPPSPDLPTQRRLGPVQLLVLHPATDA